MTKQMKSRTLPGIVAMLIGAGFAGAVAPAAAQGNAAQGATQGAAQGAAPGQGDAKAGQQKIGTCVGCHAIPGYRASYPTVFSVPMIRGQSSKYIENALNAYRSGERAHPTMRAIAGSLSDQDIADLAAYYGNAQESK
jgi:cytochrome c553